MTRVSRRTFTAGLLGATAATAATAWSANAHAEAVASATSIGALAAEKGILFGASFAVHELDAPYAADYARIYAADARILTS